MDKGRTGPKFLVPEDLRPGQLASALLWSWVPGMSAVFLHYEHGSAPFTCKIKTELGLAEALEKFRTK